MGLTFVLHKDGHSLSVLYHHLVDIQQSQSTYPVDLESRLGPWQRGGLLEGREYAALDGKEANVQQPPDASRLLPIG